MPRKKKADEPVRYGICQIHDDGTVGWFVGENMKEELYATEKLTQAAIKDYLTNSHYHWRGELVVAEYPPKKEKA